MVLHRGHPDEVAHRAAPELRVTYRCHLQRPRGASLAGVRLGGLLSDYAILGHIGEGRKRRIGYSYHAGACVCTQHQRYAPHG